MIKRRPSLVTKSALNSYQFPYISMMTLVCMFFLMMYAYYLKKMEEQSTRQGKTVEERIRKDIATNRQLAEQVTVEMTDEGVRITMPSGLVFAKGSARIQEWVAPVLSRLSQTFASLPADALIRVDGHTDDSPVWYGGDYSSNWELSLYRSLSIIRFCVDAGVSADLFSASGFSQYRPRSPNDTPLHRAANRRVEIIIGRRDLTGTEFTQSGRGIAAAGAVR